VCRRLAGGWFVSLAGGLLGLRLPLAPGADGLGKCQPTDYRTAQQLRGLVQPMNDVQTLPAPALPLRNCRATPLGPGTSGWGSWWLAHAWESRLKSERNPQCGPEVGLAICNANSEVSWPCHVGLAPLLWADVRYRPDAGLRSAVGGGRIIRRAARVPSNPNHRSNSTFERCRDPRCTWLADVNSRSPPAPNLDLSRTFPVGRVF
jgi:hypothetical protein